MKKKFRVLIDGEVYEVEVEVEESESPLQTLVSALTTGTIRKVTPPSVSRDKNVLPSPITGKVAEIRVSVGDKVDSNTIVAVLEAMKTQVEIKADRQGIIKEIFVNKGDVVKQGDPILRFK